MGEIKQANFRLDEDQVAKFREFCKEQNWDQAQGFKHLLDVLELNKAKSTIINRETDISEFEMHCKAMVESFLRSLELCNNAEVRIREDFSSQIDSKDKMIIDYQEKIMKLKENLEFSNSVVQKAAKESKDKDSRISDLNKQIDTVNKQVDTYKASNDALTAALTIANEKAKANEEAAENYSSAVKELDNVKKEVEKSQASILQLEAKHKNEVELLNHDHVAELKQMETQRQLDIKEAVETAKAEFQDKIDTIKNAYEAKITKMNDETSKRVDTYQDKLEKANEKLESVRDKMQDEIDRYKKMYEELAAESKNKVTAQST